MANQQETKAWKVWNTNDWDSSLSRHDPNSLLDVETIYAHSRGIALRKFIANNVVPKSEYKKIRSARYEKDDLIFTEEYPNGIRKSVLEYITKDNLRVNNRKEFVEKQPKSEMFYIQNGFSGNYISFWAQKGGYTTELSNAQKYTKEEVLNSFIKWGEEDIIWIASHIEQIATYKVDRQKTNLIFSIR